MPSAEFALRSAELFALANDHRVADDVPAMQVGIIVGDDAATRTFGIADVGTGRPATDETMFRIASITKTFTATALVRLAIEGRIALDDRLRAYVPEFALADRGAADRVTIRDCLLHTGGWIPHLEAIPDGPDALILGARSQAHARQIAPPGAYFSYNGVGYMVVGRVLEVVTGLSYEDAIRSMILTSLGMERTRFTTEADADVAGDHSVRDGRAAAIDDPVTTRWGHPSGGLRSTAADLMLYARCHFGESSVIGVAHAEAMAEPQRALPAPRESKALSWFVRDLGGERLLWHSGGALGQQSLLAICPRRRFAIVVLTNSAVGHIACQASLARALELFLDHRDPPPPAALSMGPDALTAYEGRYAQGDADVVLTRDADALTMRIENKGAYAQRPTPPPARLAFWEADRVMGTEGFARGQYGDFLRDADGAIAYFRWSGRARPRLRS